MIYFWIVSVLALIIWQLAPLISMHWLRLGALEPTEVNTAIRLMGIAIAFQLPSGLYIGGLMGLQRQVAANGIQVAWGVFRGFGTVLVLWLFSPTIITFAVWQVISNLAYCLLSRVILWHCLSSNSCESRPSFEWHALRGTCGYAAGMTGIAVVSTLLTQTDKLAVSKMLPLEMLGYYSLAGALASVPLALASPISSAVFPRMTGMVALVDADALTRIYHRTCQLVSVAVIPAGLTASFFAGECIFVWTGSSLTAQRAALAASLLLGGQLLQAVSVVPYYLALAHGNVRLNLTLGFASVILITPLLIVLILRYGIAGAGLSWLILNVITLPPFMYFLHRKSLPGELRSWILRDVGRPLLAVLPVLLLCRWLLTVPSSRFLALAMLGLVWAFSTCAAVSAVPDLWSLWSFSWNAKIPRCSVS
jgi:O-antigen/teichoic acid export membrane protein